MDFSVLLDSLIQALPSLLIQAVPGALLEWFGALGWLAPVGKVLLFVYALLVLYLAIMNLYRAHLAGTISKLAYVVFAPILVVGLVLDFIGNLAASIVFLQLPREWTITARLRKIVRGTSEWRIRIAEWIAKHFLDPFDPDGRHL